jgi:hypothetical protein
MHAAVEVKRHRHHEAVLGSNVQLHRYLDRPARDLDATHEQTRRTQTQLVAALARSGAERVREYERPVIGDERRLQHHGAFEVGVARRRDRAIDQCPRRAAGRTPTARRLAASTATRWALSRRAVDRQSRSNVVGDRSRLMTIRRRRRSCLASSNRTVARASRRPRTDGGVSPASMPLPAAPTRCAPFDGSGAPAVGEGGSADAPAGRHSTVACGCSGRASGLSAWATSTCTSTGVAGKHLRTD